ncbi:MAG: COX15/CtaA family protein [Pelagibacteraceae bacterium]|jgi:cytochrome c oxidase assembly protein subunit 15|nr:COX15/CtaA family protein [Pelagibacteraceae bacterium]MDP6710179.1 COX15/CtaA family protein [Pelagibacteraceae bacterium]|tara:strand:+ start:655 stop:1680 length:1026 start_codon:yes stop_codon:yes gene_type:complete
MNEENKNIYISYWLLLITFLVALMIIIGGLTRLTDSGLSITRWDLVSGILPPLSLNEWEKSFSLYKHIPEYKLLNSSMTLEQFKTIYWWEYIHRLLGRFIGIFFLIPLLYFTFKKKIKKNSLISLYLILLLILFQGFIGWFMVRSGLTEKTDVSHYRLAMHLTLAFIIFILLLWNYLEYKEQQVFISNKKLPLHLPIFFILFLLLQICIGALVSGLDAGKIYQSWPLMNQSYFPDDSNLRDLFSMKALETPSILQFIHRNVAYFIILLFSFIATFIYRYKNFTYLRNITHLIFIFLFLQTFLGILTVLSGSWIILASMHQIGAILLVTASLILVFKNSRIN